MNAMRSLGNAPVIEALELRDRWLGLK